MIKKENKQVQRKKRSLRVRTLSHIYAQVINDDKGITLASASTVQKDVIELIKGKTKTEAAFIVGQCVAKAAKKKGIKTVVYDRAGNLYTGRVKAMAEGARDAGLQF